MKPLIISVFVLWGLFRFTKLGLALRASAVDPAASRLLGVRVPWMLSIGWGFAAVLSAVWFINSLWLGKRQEAMVVEQDALALEHDANGEPGRRAPLA